MQQDNIYRLPYNPLSLYIYTWQKYFKQANRKLGNEYIRCAGRIGVDPSCCIYIWLPHRRFRGIECRVLKICDFKKVILSLFFKHNIAGLGVLIPKRYHMLG